jgi:uncharacterized damage-inducible protein DinB
VSHVTAPGRKVRDLPLFDDGSSAAGEEMKQPDAWLRGPIEGMTPYLMPVAHALVQALEDVEGAVRGLTPEQLWARPGGAASLGFHLRHIGGVVERLCTYARGEPLSAGQLAEAAAEAEPGEPPPGVDELLDVLRRRVRQALDQVSNTPFEDLLARREVGRKRIPSNVLGLLFHAAEHAQRHTGQVVATAKVVRGASRVLDVPTHAG